ncbi:alpha/beta hydrolase [Nitriliruptoraceae bacterium ZYF776]|nr:alpha/beta hydrolase [Profundirhabdus halotolerans]
MDLGTHHHVHRPGRADDAPTLLLLHGTGADERDLLPLGELLDPGASVLSPRGNVREAGMPRWFARHAEGVLDEEDVVRRAHELADWIAVATEHYDLDPTRVVAAGFSNGANIAAAVLLLRPEVLRAAALFAPMVPLRPSERVDLSATHVFVSAGRRDPICPPEQVEELVGMLTDRDAAVELTWHDGGHQLTREHAEAARAWLRTWQATTATDPAALP